jgi:arginine-tRNA-protein transferase
MWQISQAKLFGLAYVYLGYWIGASPKMSYKANYAPAQVLVEGQWSALNVPT